MKMYFFIPIKYKNSKRPLNPAAHQIAFPPGDYTDFYVVIVMPMRAFLTLIFALTQMFCWSDTPIKTTCIEVLEQARINIDAYMVSDTSLSNSFQPGVLDTAKSSLHFWLKFNPFSGELQERTGAFYGVEFQLIHPQRPYNKEAMFQWIGSQYYTLHAGWSWPNGGINGERQRGIMAGFESAAQPLFILQNAVLKDKLGQHGKGSLCLDGDGVQLELWPSKDVNLSTLPELMIRSDHQTEVYGLAPHMILVGDTFLHSYFPKGFVARFLHERKDPFVTLERDEGVSLGHIPVHALPEGVHRIRVIMTFDRDQWLDTRPTLHDGQPIVVVKDPCYTGRLVSGEIRVKVGPGGTVEQVMN